ncbi:DUF1259 domain-containing protein [Pseudonocardia aurantiaca]|uniref:DUF1259 domain-containing protein n=1 Tax=Pseudonocardia aurantiaca TaxID=75290 RepID=A0ABW4FSP7_9PSEU
MGAAIVLGGCSGNNAGQPPAAGGGQSMAAQPGASQPVQSSEADWKPVADALGRSGQLASANTVYRVSFPRRDLSVASQGVPVKAGLALGSYAAFARYGNGTTMAMGDLVVTEEELPKVTDALQQNGIAQTAVHKHLLEHTPPVWWTHFDAEGADPGAIARGLKAALDTTDTPPAAPAAPPGPIDLGTAAIDTALGAKGTNDGGIYKFTFARNGGVSMHGMALPPAMGVTTALNFQPTGGGKAAINGDFAMTADEVQKVIQALRAGGIDIVELHNHAFDDDPRLFYMHFWANDDAAKLAQALHTAVAAQNVAPAS